MSPAHRIAMGMTSAVIVALLTSLYAPLSSSAANAQTVKDSARLHLIHGHGGALTEQGDASGTIPGTVHVELILKGYTATANFTIATKSGTITGHAEGKLKFGKSGYDSFAATATITHGTGHYTHASGKGTMWGSIYRGNYAMNVQVAGQLRY